MKTIEVGMNGVIDAGTTMYPSLLRTLWGADEVAESRFGDRLSSHYGVVLAGSFRFRSSVFPNGVEISEGDFFAHAGEFELASLRPGSGIGMIVRYGFRSQSVLGRIESKGRLSYIDGCSDTILVYPPRLGDPVFNHLHFPPGVHQTQHTHPSIRFGFVLRGSGKAWSRSPDWDVPLVPGTAFLLEENEKHSFSTVDSAESMDVVAYHPDSDWGPVDGNHPMLNRTYIGNSR